MKKLIFTCCLLWAAWQGYGQDFLSLSPSDTNSFDFISRQYLNGMLGQETDSTKIARARKLHGRWEAFWKGRVANDAPPGTSIFGKVSEALDIELRSFSNCLGAGYKGNWTCLGPFTNYYNKNADFNGRVVSLWVSPTNPDSILAGSGAGGLWRTVNGGQSWTNITDGVNNDVLPGTMGITHIAVTPTNHKSIYVAAGTFMGAGQAWHGLYGLGLMYSKDGGQTWQPDMKFRQIVNTTTDKGWTTEPIVKLAYSPMTNRLYALCNKKLYVKPMAGDNQPWFDITSSVFNSYYNLSDMDFTHNPAGSILLSTTNTATDHKLYTFNEINGTLPGVWGEHNITFDPANTTAGIWDIALNAVDDVYMLVQGTAGDENSFKLYKTGIPALSTLSLLNSNLSGAANSTKFRGIEASQKNPNVLYLYNHSGIPDYPYNFIHKSANAGQTFSPIGGGHPDGRIVHIYHGGSTGGDTLFCGTDGGLSRSDKGATFKSLMGGNICVTQYYGVAVSPSDDAYMSAGAHDNGNHAYNKRRAVPWSLEDTYGDGIIPAFSRNGINSSYMQMQYGMNVHLNFSGATVTNLGGIPNPPDIMDERVAKRWMRPLKFDEHNIARLGFHFIWKKSLQDAGWSSEFGGQLNMNEPKPSIGLNTSAANLELISRHKNPPDFIISQKNPDVAYIAYSDLYWANGEAGDLYGNLFLTKNRTTFFTWENITPTKVEGCAISDLEIDPQNPNRIWVSYESIISSQVAVPSTSREKRVLYSGNYGSTWTDVSRGLPAMPVIKLLYIEGSDDLLFAATDVGVYRWSKARQQWECFNNGMPKTVVTDIDYNACSGKLKISTFGRGIWETPIEDNPSSLNPVGETNIITTNTTWSSSKTISGSIRVKAGATLTISGTGTTIYMPSRGKIAVERGAKLIIDAARITNECDGAMWLGIQVAGDINRPADPAYQGYLELKNNALLEHARLAILNFELGENTGGGIIKASNSRINNCKMAVCLNNYPNYTYFTPGTITSNCKFDNVQFIKDDPRYEIDGGGYFASWLIKGGVDIRNCTFRYSVPWQQLPYLNRSSAINVSTTGMRVESCVFDGYRRGVYISGYDNSITAPIIYNNTFDHNSESITVAASLYADIRGNVIRNMYPYKTSSGNTLTYRYPVGIYLDMGAGSYVGCSNTVSGTIDGGPNDMFLKRLGILANNNGFHNIIVTDNNLNDLSIGTQTQGGHFYLNIFCNSYNRNQLAWAVNPHASGQVEFLNDQGTSCDPVSGIRAGNRFVSNQRDINSYSAVPWRYYAGNGAYENPVWAGLMIMNNCATNSNSQCNLPRSCPQRFMTRQAHNILLNVYNLMVKAGGQYSLAGRIMQTQLIWGYKDLEDEAGLMSFLEKEKDVPSRKLLIPIYVNAAMYSQALSTIQGLDLPQVESDAYTAYYGVMISLKQQGRRIDALTPQELALVTDLAATNLEVSRLAKGLLEYAYGQDWLHPIEELPTDPMSKKIQIPETPGRQPSTLADAVPNPAGQSTMILATVSADDMALQPRLVIRNSQGFELWKTALSAGENRVTVPVNSWPAGVYFYTLELGNKVIASRKLSVVYQ
ncbi:hypothetical protein [Taibaiella chishuiensis]|uniref:Putative secreted protein (Por secretion system target) n=1 Tax=Taibaiella chishuiensis TaxID=1434707 RepID=A0A2P8DC02_9BACT|nr:hypothetical protein [Taibaiella chishuiensis]PSK94750.1 putative secreted protein (Por secretion system target) [Taibaiella chishuiensis]